MIKKVSHRGRGGGGIKLYKGIDNSPKNFFEGLRNCLVTFSVICLQGYNYQPPVLIIHYITALGILEQSLATLARLWKLLRARNYGIWEVHFMLMS